MWILISAVLVFIFFFVFLLSAVLMSRNIKKLRSPRARTVLAKRRNHTLLLTVVMLLIGVGLSLWYCVPQFQFSAMKRGGYDLRTTYAGTLQRQGADAAYPYLPNKIVPFGNTFVIQNEKGQWFRYDVTGGEGVWHWAATDTNKMATIADHMNVWLHKKGKLFVEGSFYYMDFDSDVKTYRGVLERSVKDFALSENALFYIDAKNVLWAMGYNDNGQLGDGSNKNKTEPTKIMENITDVWCSETHTMALDSFGNLYAFGDNSYAQLSTGTTLAQTTPTKIMSGIRQAATGHYFSLMLGQNGDLYSAGRDQFGQLGNGAAGEMAKATVIMSNVYKIAAFGNTAAALTYDGEVYVWGENRQEAIAKSDTVFSADPIKIADNAYDVAVCDGAIGILTRDRDVLVSGALRLEKAQTVEAALTLSATVPEEKKLPYTVTEKPDPQAADGAAQK